MSTQYPHPLQLDDHRLLILGGVDRRTRFDDLWVYDAAAEGGKGAWSRAEAAADGPSPEPRAHFTATRFGERVFVFGGYGGGGEVYGDLWVLHLGGGAFRWENVTDQLQGDGPSPRFDHAAFVFPVTPNSNTFDKLMVMGGRDVSQVLADTHLLDLGTLTWERAGDEGEMAPPASGRGVCCAVVEDVESVPYHKVRVYAARVTACDLVHAWDRAGGLGTELGSTASERQRACHASCAPVAVLTTVEAALRNHASHNRPCCQPGQVFTFGGKRGMMSYLNSVDVFDCGSKVWSTPPLEAACKSPIGRCGYRAAQALAAHI